jgi:hypothetical protein
VKPLFVSIGHRIDLDAACDLILRLTPRYRQPETIRARDHLKTAKNLKAKKIPEPTKSICSAEFPRHRESFSCSDSDEARRCCDSEYHERRIDPAGL